MKHAKRWTAKAWAENEIADVADSYSQPREHAIEHVRDLLEEDSYRDELTDEQAARALSYIKSLGTDLLGSPERNSDG